MDLSNFREEYTEAGLERESMPEQPLPLFEQWLKQAMGRIKEPNAMVLSTVGKNSRPSSRIVLLKAFDLRGFVFYTNYESRKSKQIAENPAVALLFPWHQMERQVIVNGVAERVPTSESLKYFLSRPFGSRLGAWTSPQSQVISSRSILEGKLDEMKRKFANREVPLPSFWGGFRIVPESIEFWQGRKNRLHDRFLYTFADGTWQLERLAP